MSIPRAFCAVVSTTAIAFSIAFPGRGTALDAVAQAPADAWRVAPRDTLVRHELKRALAADPVLDGAHIAVSARDGHLTLAGVVVSEAQRQRAVELARSTHGVRSVDSALEVLPAVLPRPLR